MGVAFCVVLLAGCSAGTSTPLPPDGAPAAPTSASSTMVAGQAVLDELVRAARGADRSAFDQNVSTRDPSFGDRARLLYTNLSTLPLAELTLQLQPGAEPLTDSRRDLLGAAAWRQPAVARWRLTGEPAAAEHTVWLTFAVDSGRTLLAGTVDRPAGTPVPEPIWWTGPVTAVRDGTVMVVLGSGQPAQAWLRRSRNAVDAVRGVVASDASDASDGWSGELTVEVPASRRDFEAVLGADAGSYAAIAAVTLAAGPTTSAALRVVVNPDVSRRLAPVGVAVVLTHETVHVATHSADSPAPTWAVEGFADYVALQAHPGAADEAVEPLLSQVRRSGPPSALPGNERFRAGEPDLAVTYAAASSLCRYVATTYSAASLRRLYNALDAGEPLERAAPDQLGVSATRLTADWRRYLRRLAGG